MAQATHESQAQQVPDAAKKAFRQGLEAERKLDRWQAIEAFRGAREQAPEDPAVCFKLAYHLDLVGEEEEALRLYQQACSGDQPKVHAMLNLAILYEDEEQYAEAEECLKRVVQTDPNHERARLFLKDVEASRDAEEAEAEEATAQPHSPLADMRVDRLELSNPTQEKLYTAGLRTVGDLLRTPETDLRSASGMDEQTVEEVKTVLAQRGLRVGQDAEPVGQPTEAATEPSGGDQGILDQPIAELGLSARAQKALGMLDAETVRELINHTEEQLLAVKHFGQTSLQEIKSKLAQYDLQLPSSRDSG